METTTFNGKIRVNIRSIKITEITEISQEVTVTGDHIKDGEYTATIKVPLEKPRKMIETELMVHPDDIGHLMRGYMYTANDGLSYFALNNEAGTLKSVGDPVEMDTYQSPSFAIPIANTMKEGATKPVVPSLNAFQGLVFTSIQSAADRPLSENLYTLMIIDPPRAIWQDMIVTLPNKLTAIVVEVESMPNGIYNEGTTYILLIKSTSGQSLLGSCVEGDYVTFHTDHAS